MLVRELLGRAGARLESAGIESARLDALLLLAEAAGIDKAGLLARLAEPVDEESAKRFEIMLLQRLEGVPVSYILRRKEFRGLEFYVDERVLVPRPDTETLVEAALGLIAAFPGPGRLHDACTGSGCVAISLAHELSSAGRPAGGWRISASDLSEGALEIFRLNCARLLGRELPHRRSDLLASAGGPFELITANPPYVRSAEVAAMKGRRWPEPALALDGGGSGLDLLARLVEEAVPALSPGGWLLVEADDSQAEAVAGLMAGRGYGSISHHLDLAGRRRVSSGRGPGL